ncbi:hypothetical protein U8V72_28070 [Priestia filamentosa]|uniref:hypothetical protein n=1 Tax=Priestia filamentosa TaxID=1402861 RepID=UPI0039780799
MSKVQIALENLQRLGLKLEDALDASLYATDTNEVVALYDGYSEDTYKGVILFSENANAEEVIGDVEWYIISGLKIIYTL